MLSKLATALLILLLAFSLPGCLVTRMSVTGDERGHVTYKIEAETTAIIRR